MNQTTSFFDRSGRFVYLLGSLLGLLIASAFVEQKTVLFNILLTLTLLSSIYAISHDRRFVVGGIIFALATFISSWLAQLFGSSLFGIAASLFGFVYFQFTNGVILIHIFRSPTITIDELLASISAYLLLGVAGGFIFRFLEILDPNALIPASDVVTAINADSPMTLFIYYSFTCLTTLGFGDIVPGTPGSRVFSYLSAVIGQLYLTVLIARFVGLHISQLRRD